VSLCLIFSRSGTTILPRDIRFAAKQCDHLLRSVRSEFRQSISCFKSHSFFPHRQRNQRAVRYLLSRVKSQSPSRCFLTASFLVAPVATSRGSEGTSKQPKAPSSCTVVGAIKLSASVYHCARQAFDIKILSPRLPLPLFSAMRGCHQIRIAPSARPVNFSVSDCRAPADEVRLFPSSSSSGEVCA